MVTLFNFSQVAKSPWKPLNRPVSKGSRRYLQIFRDEGVPISYDKGARTSITVPIPG